MDEARRQGLLLLYFYDNSNFGGKSIKPGAALGVKPATDDASSHLSVHHQTTNYSVGMINDYVRILEFG